MTSTFALIGAKALCLIYVWLLSAIVASYLSERKGYGEKLGLAFGLLLSVLGADHLAVLAGAAGLQVEEPRPDRPRQGRPRGGAGAGGDSQRQA